LCLEEAFPPAQYTLIEVVVALAAERVNFCQIRPDKWVQMLQFQDHPQLHLLAAQVELHKWQSKSYMSRTFFNHL
jgi:hypothetical protein